MLERRLGELADEAARATELPPVERIRRRARRRRAARVAAAGGLVAAVIAGAFISTVHHAVPPPPSPPLASSAPVPSAHESAEPTQVVTQSGSPTGKTITPCRAASGLRVTEAPRDGGSTHRGLVLVFTNHGSVPCRTAGYPGVAALDASGAQIAQAQRTPSGYLGGATVRPLTIPPGGSASAIVEAMAAMPNGDACTPYAGLLVTAPDDTASTPLPWRNDGCTALQIHPIAAA